MTSLNSINYFKIRKELIQQLLLDSSPYATCKLVDDVYWLYNYYTELRLFNFTIQQELSIKYPGVELMYHNDSLIPTENAKYILDADQCKLRVAVICWLSLELEPSLKGIIKDIPKNIQYGLVLDYPSPILRGAAYLLDNSLENYDDASIGYIQGEVVTFLVENHFPYMLENDILREVNKRQKAQNKTK